MGCFCTPFLALVLVVILVLVIILILVLTVVLLAILILILVIHFRSSILVLCGYSAILFCPIFQDLSLALKSMLATSPKKIAAAIPGAQALSPPEKIPRNPSS